MEALVELKNLNKSYGNFTALKGLDLSIQAGEILTLLGPNGAGKSTTIGIILGLVKPSSGSVFVMGGSPLSKNVRKQFGCTPQDCHFPDNAKVKEILELVSSHYDESLPISEVAQRFMIADLMNRKASKLSGGQRRCLALACAFIGKPKIILLDEPTVGLDVEVRKNLWSEIQRYRNQGGTVLLTTHYLEEAESISDRIVVINKGRVFREGTPEDIKHSFGRNVISFQTTQSIELPKTVQWRKEGRHYTVVSENSDEFIRQTLVQWEFENLEIRPLSLEEAFLEILKDGDL